MKEDETRRKKMGVKRVVGGKKEEREIWERARFI